MTTPLADISDDAVYSVGNAWSKVALTEKRQCMIITHDPLGANLEVPYLYVTFVAVGASAPTRALPELIIPAQVPTVLPQATSEVDVYIKNSSGAATPHVPYTARGIKQTVPAMLSSGGGSGGSGGSSGIGVTQTTPITPPRIAIILTSSSSAILEVECWDGDHLPLLFDASDPSVETTLTGASEIALFNFLFTQGIETGATVPGMPNGTKGCRLKVSETSLGSIAVNFAGTTDGTGVNGIDPTSAGPTANSPLVLKPGDAIVVGLQ